MVQILTKEDFIIVPWKNGRGVTSELTRLSKSSGDESFDFRLSVAKVEQNGAFSFYEGHDRCLVLLKGDGFKLLGPNPPIILNQFLDYCYFQGEESIDCELVGSACEDFNIFINRQYGRFEIEIEIVASRIWKALNFTLFIYLVNTQELIILKESEIFYREDFIPTPAILVRLYLFK